MKFFFLQQVLCCFEASQFNGASRQNYDWNSVDSICSVLSTSGMVYDQILMFTRNSGRFSIKCKSKVNSRWIIYISVYQALRVRGSWWKTFQGTLDFKCKDKAQRFCLIFFKYFALYRIKIKMAAVKWFISTQPRIDLKGLNSNVLLIFQSVIFHVETHPNFTDFTQCVTFNALSPTGEVIMEMFNHTDAISTRANSIKLYFSIYIP